MTTPRPTLLRSLERQSRLAANVSGAAVVAVFATAFVTDQTHWSFDFGKFPPLAIAGSAALVVMGVGYLFSCWRPAEVTGSALALTALAAFFVVTVVATPEYLPWAVAVAALPAALHLLAAWLHHERRHAGSGHAHG